MRISRKDTAVLIVDPRIDLLSEEGTTWVVVGESAEERLTVANLERIVRAARRSGFEIFLLAARDPAIQPGGRAAAMGRMAEAIRNLDRGETSNLVGFSEPRPSGGELPQPFAPRGRTLASRARIICGTEADELVGRLRRHHIKKVILAGISDDLRVEAQLNELLDQGFEVAVVKDAAPRLPLFASGEDNRFPQRDARLASSVVLTTDEVVRAMR